MNIYDFIDDPIKAVKGGYKPCYLDKVSFLLNLIFSFRWFTEGGYKNTSFGLHRSIFDNLMAIRWALVWFALLLSIPVTCWLIALLPIGGRIKS